MSETTTTTSTTSTTTSTTTASPPSTTTTTLRVYNTTSYIVQNGQTTASPLANFTPVEIWLENYPPLTNYSWTATGLSPAAGAGSTASGVAFAAAVIASTGITPGSTFSIIFSFLGGYPPYEVVVVFSSATTTSTTTLGPVRLTWTGLLSISNQIYENPIYGANSIKFGYSTVGWLTGTTLYWRTKGVNPAPTTANDFVIASGTITTASGNVEVTAVRDTSVERNIESFRIEVFKDNTYSQLVDLVNECPVAEIIDSDYGTTSIKSVTIQTSGSGYSYAPIVTFSEPDQPSGILARAIVQVTVPGMMASGSGSLVVSSIIITNPGNGYLSPPSVYIGTSGARSWTASTAYQSGTLLVASGRYYLVTSGGTTAASVPTHTTGSATHGTAVLLYVEDPNAGGSGATATSALVSPLVIGPPARVQQNIAYGNEQFDTGFRVFIDMNQQRFTSAFTPTHIVELTQPLYIGDANIFVTDGSVLGEPDADILRPGIVSINGERIIYYEKVGNRLSRLRRGVGGTGVPQVHLARSDVEDVGPQRYDNEIANDWYPEIIYRAYPSNNQVDEGRSITFTLETQNTDPGQVYYWTNSGTTKIVDFVDYDTTFVNYGTLITNGTWALATANVTVVLRSDNSTEGTETIIFNVHKGTRFTVPVAQAEVVTVNDLSIIPAYYITPRLEKVQEGDSIILDIETQGVAAGTTLYWTNSGTSNGGDFIVEVNSGSVTVGGAYNSGYSTLRIDTKMIPGQQVAKTFVAQLRRDSVDGPEVQTANVVYIDHKPDPEYSLKANAYLVDEGRAVRFDFVSKYAQPGLTYFWYNTGTVTTLDIDPANLNGQFVTTGTYFTASASVIITPIEDVKTEGSETIVITVHSTNENTINTRLAGPESVVVQDSSIAPAATCTVDRNSVLEGEDFTFTILTEGIAPGTKLWFKNTGTSTSADYVLYPNPEQVTVTGTYKNGTAVLKLTTSLDMTPLAPSVEEGPETFVFNVYLVDPNVNLSALTLFPPISVNIFDTSKETTTTTTTTEAPATEEPPPGAVLDKFYNGNFEITTPFSRTPTQGIDTLPGWKVYKPGYGTVPKDLRLDGRGGSTILGCPTPSDPTPFIVTDFNPTGLPKGAAPGDYPSLDSVPYNNGFQFDWDFVQNAPGNYHLFQGLEDPGQYIIRLSSNGTTTKGFGVVRGPYLVSSNAIDVLAGDKVVFSYKAVDVSDDFDVFAYLLNESNCNTILLLDDTGKKRDWTKVEYTILPGQEGVYKFVFINGTHDYTGGMALGSYMYLDNIDKIVDPTRPTTVANAWTINVIPTTIVGGTQFTINYGAPGSAIGDTFLVNFTRNIPGTTGISNGDFPIEFTAAASGSFTINSTAVISNQTFSFSIGTTVGLTVVTSGTVTITPV